MLSVSTTITNEDNLERMELLLKSLSFADEIQIFVLGEFGNQKLSRLAKKYHAKLIEVNKPLIVEYVRDRQIKSAEGDWVLIMDFDEVVPPRLARAILSAVKSKGSEVAYAIPRDNYSLGQKLAHGGWERDYVVRLIKKSTFLGWPRDIHSSPRVDGPVGKLVPPMEHHKDENLSYIVNKTNRYSESEAKQYLEGGLPLVTPLTLLRKLTLEFFRRAILKKGLLDGDIGLIQSLYQGFSVFVSYAKLYELQIKKEIEKPL